MSAEHMREITNVARGWWTSTLKQKPFPIRWKTSPEIFHFSLESPFTLRVKASQVHIQFFYEVYLDWCLNSGNPNLNLMQNHSNIGVQESSNNKSQIKIQIVKLDNINKQREIHVSIKWGAQNERSPHFCSPNRPVLTLPWHQIKQSPSTYPHDLPGSYST